MARYRQFGNDTAIIEGGSMKIVHGRTQDARDEQHVYIHLEPPEDDQEEDEITDAQLRRMVDRLGPRVRRTRVSDNEEALSHVSNISDVRFPATRRIDAVTEAERAVKIIRAREQRVAAVQKRNDDFWKRQCRR
jgi:hypothetical protein